MQYRARSATYAAKGGGLRTFATRDIGSSHGPKAHTRPTRLLHHNRSTRLAPTRTSSEDYYSCTVTSGPRRSPMTPLLDTNFDNRSIGFGEEDGRLRRRRAAGCFAAPRPPGLQLPDAPHLSKSIYSAEASCGGPTHSAPALPGTSSTTKCNASAGKGGGLRQVPEGSACAAFPPPRILAQHPSRLLAYPL